jgi:formate dehydrogenase accessory protein FdhE
VKTPAATESRVAAAFARRAARADALGASCRTAGAPLRFAAELYRAQRELSLAVAASHGRSPLCGCLERDLPAFTHGFVPLLRLAVEGGPSALVEEARTHVDETASQALSRLQAFWNAEQESAESHYLSRALLRPYVEVLRSVEIAPDRAHGPGQCPFCGAAPWIAARRSEEDAAGGRRFLGCALCGEEWAFARIQCPSCMEEDPTKLPAFQSESRPGVRVEACDTCRRYVKSIDLTMDARALPEVDDLVSLEMDLWAQEQGYDRLEPGLAGC